MQYVVRGKRRKKAKKKAPHLDKMKSAPDTEARGDAKTRNQATGGELGNSARVADKGVGATRVVGKSRGKKVRAFVLK